MLEAPLSLAALINASTLRTVCQQLALRGIAYSEGWRASIPVSEVSADLVRLAILGQARFSKGTVKREVIGYCRARGWKVPEDSAADAVLTWLWQVQQLRGQPPAAGPLFRQKGETLQ